MEQIVSLLVGKALEYGPAGLFIAYLIYQLIQVKRDFSDRDGHIRQMYEDRLKASEEAIKVLSANTVANEKLAQAFSVLSDKLAQNNERLAQNSDRLERMERRGDK